MTSTAIAQSTRHAVIDTPIGELTVVRDQEGLTGVYFPEHWTRPDRTLFGPQVAPDDGFSEVQEQFDAYFAGRRTDFDLPLNPQGSRRAQTVWQLISAIPYGRTTTYGALAEQVGPGISARAIGGLVGHNPLSIIVPCHRVVGSTGKLTGYAGGLERKEHLLTLEGARPESMNPLW
jgi:methylated-DNA-[protein]-cysteine S-methyltransferase